MKYVTYDFEGELVCKDGKPVLHDTYEEANEAKGMGVVAEYEAEYTEEDTAVAVFEEPLPEVYTRTQSYFNRLLDLAEAQVPDTIKVDTAQHKACVAFNIVREIEAEKESTKAIQLGVLIEVAELGLYLAHPPTDDYPNGFNNIRDFMKAAGMNPKGGHFYEMAQFASEVVPYLEAKNIDYDLNVDSTQVAKTLEAVPAMRRMIRSKERKNEFTKILKELLDMPGKRAATARYRTRRDGVRYGDACVNQADGLTIITITTPDAEEIVKALTGVVTFDKLIATVNIKGRLIEVTTSRP